MFPPYSDMKLSQKTHIKNMRYEDFGDNEYLEKYVEELQRGGTNVVLTTLGELIDWQIDDTLEIGFVLAACEGALKKAIDMAEEIINWIARIQLINENNLNR